MPLTRPIRRPATHARGRVLDALKQDHLRVLQAFQEFEHLELRASPSECGSLVKRVCADLTVHDRIESELIYPTARNCLTDVERVDHAEARHDAARSLVERLTVMSPHDEQFVAAFHDLMAHVRRHIQEEERGVLRRLSRVRFDWPTLAILVDLRRAELSDQYAPELPLDAGPGAGGFTADQLASPAPGHCPPMARTTRSTVASPLPQSSEA